mmetsp:Transcript_31015/g.75338  ORF Transcript_31015/g.75338 Transcript_31015/m.75338 type:complete len:212 (+) Transcript_31015:300-935(+)
MQSYRSSPSPTPPRPPEPARSSGVRKSSISSVGGTSTRERALLRLAAAACGPRCSSSSSSRGSEWKVERWCAATRRAQREQCHRCSPSMRSHLTRCCSASTTLPRPVTLSGTCQKLGCVTVAWPHSAHCTSEWYCPSKRSARSGRPCACSERKSVCHTSSARCSGGGLPSDATSARGETALSRERSMCAKSRASWSGEQSAAASFPSARSS